jgi:hypothetical protein
LFSAALFATFLRLLSYLALSVLIRAIRGRFLRGAGEQIFEVGGGKRRQLFR